MASKELKLINSEGLYGAAYDEDEQKLTVQFSRGLAKYRYSNFGPDMAQAMEAQTSHVGRWFRTEVVLKPDVFPCEKL